MQTPYPDPDGIPTPIVSVEHAVPAVAHSTTALPEGLHRRWPVHWVAGVHFETMCEPAPQGSGAMQQISPVPHPAPTAHSSCVLQPQLHEAQLKAGF